MSERLVRWFVFGVVIALLPLVFRYLLELTDGHAPTVEKVLSQGALVGAAVSCVTTRYSRRAAGRREQSTRDHSRQLATEYSKIRADMEPGQDRTLRMEWIADQMRALGSVRDSTLQDLIISDLPG